MTILNSTLGLDVGGPTAFAAMVKQGDGWIGIATQPDTARIQQAWVYMTGVSQSAIYIRTWLAAFHDRYDGYLGVVGPAMIRINRCAADVALEDPKQKLVAPEVPFISISSEGEMWQARYTHQSDAFTRKGGIVTYEVAGASHRAADVPGVAPDAISHAAPTDMTRAGFKMPGGGALAGSMPAGSLPNDFVWQPLIRGAYHNPQLWVRQGVKPPRAPDIELDATSEIRRDAFGNALGGARMSYIEAPTAWRRSQLRRSPDLRSQPPVSIASWSSPHLVARSF